MFSPITKTRQTIKSRFVRGATPSESDFSDLINSAFNQAEDGVRKPPTEPLSLVRQKPDQPLVRFYEDPSMSGNPWQFELAAGERAGLAICNGAAKPSLFIDKTTGYVGIGTNEPKMPLHVSGTASVNKLEADEVWIAGKQVKSEQSFGNKIAVLDNGNVGIGTTTPQERLSVHGNVSIHGNVTRNVWGASRAIAGHEEGRGKWEYGIEDSPGSYHNRNLERTLKIFKKYDDSVLRVCYSDEAEATESTVLQIRVDGKEDGCLQLRFANSRWEIFPILSLGFLEGIPAGAHEIQVWLRVYPGCASNLTFTRAYGYRCSSNWCLEAEEVWINRL